jgi:formylglycine-generating enzyme
MKLYGRARAILLGMSVIATSCTTFIPVTIAADAPSGLLKAPFDEPAAKANQQEWARRLNRRVVETSPFGLSLTLVPPGEFMMGRSESLEQLKRLNPRLDKDMKLENGIVGEIIESEQPQHRVRITRPFYIGTYNVTRGQFRTFVQRTGYRTDAETSGKGAFGYSAEDGGDLLTQRPEYNWLVMGFPQEDDHPVVNVSWNDATAFCEWLSKKEGSVYRLPTEAEWEYAYRAGTSSFYSFGDDPEQLTKYANVADRTHVDKVYPPSQFDELMMNMHTVRSSDGFAFTSPVGRFRPNAFGVYDMHGNAGTWCSDRCQLDAYAKSETDDPKGPASGEQRVTRGGSWAQSPFACRCASRSAAEATTCACNQGFRIVREQESGAEKGVEK